MGGGHEKEGYPFSTKEDIPKNFAKKISPILDFVKLFTNRLPVWTSSMASLGISALYLLTRQQNCLVLADAKGYIYRVRTETK